ncbi:iron-containing alcohol dehydrogenase [Bacillus badius]|uniref:Alcohol dehydrogenase n=1 Tax=Bacillus badius TaxID=1455 RepID=A0ABR5AYN7_BACBA|nr:iron-containing alcohol dehydrogenase [Bacillus badius]KIL76098.1 Alcohol dehydrogenase [Bacillus badius]KIL79338.1 Alcohol dehydrogenase [Bacillus badius]KZO00327.1 alcohol dehydrogenase [Bacillus badius]MED0668378.1 iron-containing alcohol dehydrogenase [Bacillus badius]MED4716522.1 iron-containing alcohol dehydrogenase [Bacillus badius]
MYKFVMPEIIFGSGSMKHTGESCTRLGAKRVLIVTDEGVTQAGWSDLVETSCREAGLASFLFSNVSINPKDKEVESCARAYLDYECDALVGVGGGSAIDTAKAAAVLATNGGHIRDYEGVDRISSPLPPLVMVPTTAGSGSEVSQFSVILDTDRQKKMTIVSKSLVPDIAVVDPDALSTKSSYLTASTGLDVITHAIESFVSVAATPLTDVHAKNALALSSRYLRPSVASKYNKEAKEQMAMASLHAGLAFSNAILGAVHAMAHAIGGRYPFLHGDINAVLLPHVMEFNLLASPDKFKEIASLMGEDVQSLSPSAAGEKAISFVKKLSIDIGAPLTLSEMGFEEAFIPEISETALADACMITNPRDITAEEVASLLRKAL